MLVFLDTEFTDLAKPELLSLGMVALNGLEHYGELDLATDVGHTRVKAASEFVREVVLPQWGAVRGASCTELELGRRAGEFLLNLAGRLSAAGDPLTVAFDYEVDFRLLEDVIRQAGLIVQVREARVVPLNIGSLTDSMTGDSESEECIRSLVHRGIGRHHSLADALALRAAYLGVKRNMDWRSA
jgi:hypothetical protein